MWAAYETCKGGIWELLKALSSKVAAMGPTDKVKSTMAVCMRQRDFGNLDQVHFDPPFTTEPARRLSQGNSI